MGVNSRKTGSYTLGVDFKVDKQLKFSRVAFARVKAVMFVQHEQFRY